MRSVFLVVLGVLGLSGCYLTVAEVGEKLDSSGNDSAADSGLFSGPLQIRGVEPDWSAAAGGAEITISAGPLGENVQVTMGGVAADVLSSTAQQVVVSSPSGLVGEVDVMVRSDAERDTLEAGLRYFPDEAGKTTLIGSYSWFTWAGYDVDYTQPANRGFAWIRPIEPEVLSYADMVTGAPQNDCVSGHQPPVGTTRRIDTNEVALVRSGGVSATLVWDPPAERYESELNEGQHMAGAHYDLASLHTGNWPGVGVLGLVSVPDRFVVTEPNLAWEHWRTSFKKNGRISWSGGTPGDYMVIVLERYELVGVQPVEVVTCLAMDTGSFTLPVDVWRGWSVGGALRLTIGRISRTQALVPHTGANTDVVGANWVVGSVGQGG